MSEDSLPGPPDHGFVGRTLCCNDGSAWKITEALSHRKYQRWVPPFEARQVFACVRVPEPTTEKANSSGVQEAVIKIKYQVKGEVEAIEDLECHIAWCKERLDRSWGPAALVQAEKLLRAAKHPVKTVNDATYNELEALDVFRQTRCAYAPHIVACQFEVGHKSTDELAMPNGYITYVVMTKVPGRSLTHDAAYWGFPPEKREEIRQSFKQALIGIWKAHIYQHDNGLRNIVWDDMDRKCYIVDFEDSGYYNVGDPEVNFDEDYYSFWGLTESGRM